jgi:fibronectin type 3 domain-containing protein
VKLIRTGVLALALLASASGAGAQDKTTHSYAVTVGHVVTLSWTASTTTDVTAYNIYVSGTSGGPYTRIGTTPLPQFMDLGGIAGTKYFYVVTAVDGNGESAFSSEVSVTLPTP